MFDQYLTELMLEAGKEEKQFAINNKRDHQGLPAITVIVDAGWSKRSHQHSYNANSGVGVIFGVATNKLLYIGVRNKYCAVALLYITIRLTHLNTCVLRTGQLQWKLTSLLLDSEYQRKYMVSSNWRW